jgi:hypothetical protein
MSYNVGRQVTPALAVCSLSSSASGLATITYINGDFTPSISGTDLTLEAGYEYFLITSPATVSAVTATYETLIDGVSQGAYPIRSTSLTGSLDEKFDSVLATSSTLIQITANNALSANSRLQIWRIPL